MNPPATSALVAVDIGNSRTKLGWFAPSSAATAVALANQSVRDLGPAHNELRVVPSEIAVPSQTCFVSGRNSQELQRQIADWIDAILSRNVSPWWVASVHRGQTAALFKVLEGVGVYQVTELTWQGIPLAIRTEAPHRVGIDRLAGAVAANALREVHRPAIVIDLGTAITVDLVAADGGFEGGAILPGIAIAAEALERHTEALPRSPLVELSDPPIVIGRSTLTAIHAGLYWGTVGAIRELVDRMSSELNVSPQLFLTGGAAPQVAAFIQEPDRPVGYFPHLVLSGIALSARYQSANG